jgi:hypothetical protein
MGVMLGLGGMDDLFGHVRMKVRCLDPELERRMEAEGGRRGLGSGLGGAFPRRRW